MSTYSYTATGSLAITVSGKSFPGLAGQYNAAVITHDTTSNWYALGGDGSGVAPGPASDFQSADFPPTQGPACLYPTFLESDTRTNVYYPTVPESGRLIFTGYNQVPNGSGSYTSYPAYCVLGGSVTGSYGVGPVALWAVQAAYVNLYELEDGLLVSNPYFSGFRPSSSAVYGSYDPIFMVKGLGSVYEPNQPSGTVFAFGDASVDLNPYLRAKITDNHSLPLAGAVVELGVVFTTSGTTFVTHRGTTDSTGFTSYAATDYYLGQSSPDMPNFTPYFKVSFPNGQSYDDRTGGVGGITAAEVNAFITTNQGFTYEMGHFLEAMLAADWTIANRQGGSAGWLSGIEGALFVNWMGIQVTGYNPDYTGTKTPGGIACDSKRGWLHVATANSVKTFHAIDGAVAFTGPTLALDQITQLAWHSRQAAIYILGASGSNQSLNVSWDGGQTMKEVGSVAAANSVISIDSKRNWIVWLLEDTDHNVTCAVSRDGGATFDAAFTPQYEGADLVASLIGTGFDERRAALDLVCSISDTDTILESQDAGKTWALVATD